MSTPGEAAVNRFEAELKVDLDRASADGRFQQLQAEEGLIDCEGNAKLLGDFFKQNKLALNVANVNRAVEALRAQLTWEPPTPAAEPAAVVEPPAMPAEVLGLVAGTQEPQLPINADQRTMKAASVAQLRDLDRRIAGRRRPAGSFGSRF